MNESPMKMDPGWVRTSHLLRELMHRLTTELSAWVITQPVMARSPATTRAYLEQVVKAISDPHPDESLADSAARPFPFYSSPLVQGPISPLTKWKEIERGSHLWPKVIRQKSALLGIGSGKLPTWRQIDRYFSEIGCRAVPVQGYVGATIYSFLLSHGRVPVSTQWVLRYRRAPYYLVPTDTFHDIGHGLAMIMPDYKKLLVDFSKAALRTGKFLATKKIEHNYGRFFEHSYVYDEDGNIEPIGPAPLAFETLRIKNGRLCPLVKDKDFIKKQKEGYRPFSSREEWRRETRAFISLLETRYRVQN